MTIPITALAVGCVLCDLAAVSVYVLQQMSEANILHCLINYLDFITAL